MVPTEQTNSIKSKITELKTQYKESLDKAQRVISDLENEKQKLLTENTDLLTRIEAGNSAITREKERLAEELAETKNQLASARRKSQETDQQVKDFQTKISHLDELSRIKKNELDELRKEFETSNQQSKININKITIIANKRKELVENYKQKADEFESEVRSLRQENEKLASYETKIRDLNKQLKGSKQLEEKLLKQEEEIADQAKEQHKLEKQIESLNSENQKLKAQADELKISVKNLVGQKTELLSRITAMEQESIAQKAQFDQLKKYEKEFNKIKENLEKQIGEYKSKITGQQQEIDKLIKTETEFNNKITGLETELSTAVKSLKDAKSTKATLEHELREVKESYELKLDIKERKVKDLSRNIEEELKNNAKINAEKDSLAHNLTIITGELERNKAGYQALQDELNTKEKEIDELIGEYSLKQEELEKQVQDLNGELEGLKAAREKEAGLFRAEQENFKNTVNSLRKELEENNKAKLELDDKQKLIQDLSLDAADKTSRLNHSIEEVNDLTAELEKLKQSKKRETDRFDKEINSLIEENSNFKVTFSKKEIELDRAKQEINNLKKIIDNLSSGKSAEISKIESSNKEIKQELEEKDNQILELESEIELLKSKLERTKKTKDNEIQHLYREIEKFNKKQLRSSHMNTIDASEKDNLIESLEDKNEELLEKIEFLSQAKNDDAERYAASSKEAKNSINKLNDEIASLNLKFKQNENELRESRILINSLKKQAPVPEAAPALSEEEVQEGITHLLEKENSEIRDEIDDLKDKAKNLEIKEKDLTSIEELYRATLQHKQILEQIVDEQLSQPEEADPEEETPEEEEFIKKLELYKDLISEEKTNPVPGNGDGPRQETAAPERKTPVVPDPVRNNGLKKQVLINLEQESASRTINEQLEKVERSLSHLQNKKSRAQKLDNTIYIFGGNKELEESWKHELERCLQEYGLTHQWLLNSDKEVIRGPGKGIIFLISVSSLQYLENSELILRNTNIPAIRHPLSNITKLKLDIIDNFVRKKA
jgi:chromosome segregation ATPase